MPALNQFTWSQFWIMGASLLVVYIALQLLYQLAAKSWWLRSFQTPLKRGLRRALLIYEPFAILLLGTAFILVNVPFHGILMLLVVVLGFGHIRNYVSGQIIKTDPNLSVGKQLDTNEIEGMIVGMGKLGLRVRTRKGQRYVRYSTLFREGYVLLSGETIGGYYQLRLEPVATSEKENTKEVLMDRLAFSPYLDWNHKPELVHGEEEESKYKVNIIIKEESHLYDLISQIKEWGFNCKIITK